MVKVPSPDIPYPVDGNTIVNLPNVSTVAETEAFVLAKLEITIVSPPSVELLVIALVHVPAPGLAGVQPPAVQV